MPHTSYQPPTMDASTDSCDPRLDALARAYRLIADLFVYPERVDRDALVADAREHVIPAVDEHLDSAAATSLREFLVDYQTVDLDQYVATLELDPDCPLYLGHYEFDEPESCREIADADRNQYMVELNGIYEHFGFELEDELPDFLPAMVEFCWLTLPDRDDDLRTEFLSKTQSLLPSMRDGFESAGTPYLQLVDALEGIMATDIALATGDDGDTGKTSAPLTRENDGTEDSPNGSAQTTAATGPPNGGDE